MSHAMYPAAFTFEGEFPGQFPTAIAEAGGGSFVHDDLQSAVAMPAVIPGVGPEFLYGNRTKRGGHLIFWGN